jgi:transcriptional regulator with XRE-family HTH domain
MDDAKAGRLVATVRRHLRFRQADVGELAGVDQKVVSLIERGLLARVSVERFRRVCAVLEIEPVLDLRWRGGLGDRLIDRGHANLVEMVASMLRVGGWTVIPEYSFNVYGERGSVDILAWHPERRVLLIVEVKTRVTDLQAMLMSMSRKVRVVPAEVADDRGWVRHAMGRVVVMAETRANRSMVATHRSTFDSSFPGRTAETRRWLAAPSGDYAGVMFVTPRRDSTRDAVHGNRVRRRPGRRPDEGSSGGA